jgi:hypothetical protein
MDIGGYLVCGQVVEDSRFLVIYYLLCLYVCLLLRFLFLVVRGFCFSSSIFLCPLEGAALEYLFLRSFWDTYQLSFLYFSLYD